MLAPLAGRRLHRTPTTLVSRGKTYRLGRGLQEEACLGLLAVGGDQLPFSQALARVLASAAPALDCRPAAPPELRPFEAAALLLRSAGRPLARLSLIGTQISERLNVQTAADSPSYAGLAFAQVQLGPDTP